MNSIYALFMCIQCVKWVKVTFCPGAGFSSSYFVFPWVNSTGGFGPPLWLSVLSPVVHTCVQSPAPPHCIQTCMCPSSSCLFVFLDSPRDLGCVVVIPLHSGTVLLEFVLFQIKSVHSSALTHFFWTVQSLHSWEKHLPESRGRARKSQPL